MYNKWNTTETKVDNLQKCKLLYRLSCMWIKQKTTKITEKNALVYLNLSKSCICSQISVCLSAHSVHQHFQFKSSQSPIVEVAYWCTSEMLPFWALVSFPCLSLGLLQHVRMSAEEMEEAHRWLLKHNLCQYYLNRRKGCHVKWCSFDHHIPRDLPDYVDFFCQVP